MSSNNRILYSCQGVAISNMGDDSLTAGEMVHGVQSIGITTNFNLEQVFELGQIEIYENIEGTPDVEVTLEKVLDGYPLIYLMASTGVAGTNSSGILSRSKQRCDLRLGIYGEEFNNIDEATDNTGNAEVEVYCSGMYISSVGYTLPVDGNATESVTLAGNNKEWLTGAQVKLLNTTVTAFDGEDAPLALGSDGFASGGVQRREDVLLYASILPQSVRGTTGSGVANAFLGAYDGYSVFGSGQAVHLQNVSINTDFSREDVLELGRKTPYYRPANFPIEVTCEMEAITTSGDFVSAYEEGDPTLHNTVASGNNTREEIIYLVLRGGMVFDLGPKNRLSSVSYGGGDATGGNASVSYSYSNFNDLDVKQVGHNSVSVMGYNDTATSIF